MGNTGNQNAVKAIVYLMVLHAIYHGCAALVMLATVLIFLWLSTNYLYAMSHMVGML